MNAARTDRPTSGRVLLALDASPPSLAALATAEALAAEFDAELAGLFVEDINLQRLLALPFAREFCVLSGEMRSLSLDEVERAWRREAAQLERRLAEAAGQLQLRWSFQVTRGRMATEVSVQAQGFDLVVLGRQPGAAFMTVVQTSPLPRKPGSVLVRVDAAEPSGGGFDLGARLARRSGGELVLLIEAAEDAAFQATCGTARETLRPKGVQVRCVRLLGAETAELVNAVRRESAGCLVLGDRDRFLQGGRLEALLDAVGCPIVLAR